MTLLTLIVDDDKISTHLTRAALQRHGLCHSFETAANGKEAIRYLEYCLEKNTVLPSIIMLDLNMLGGDGWQFLADYKQLEPKLKQHIHIFILSSFLNTEEYEKAYHNVLVSAFFSKPLVKQDMEEIQSIVQSKKVVIDLQ